MNNTFKFAKSVAWQVEPTRGYIYVNDIKNGFFYKLETVAKEIWILISQGKSVNEICSQLSEHYIIDYEILVRDVQDFIDDMQFKEIIYSL